MKNKVVTIDPTKRLIVRSPGFEKKALATHKIDLMGLCGFGCQYCSSNDGNFLRINRKRFADETAKQLGERMIPAQAPALTFEFRDVLTRLDEQLAGKDRLWGEGKVLMVSQLTDAFSPRLVKQGVTMGALKRILERTSFTIRILTKSAAVARADFIELFRAYRSRVIVGCSIGTLDDEWSRAVEVGTSTPAARVRAIRQLQSDGIRTYGMLCPVFPAYAKKVGEILDGLRSHMLETVWVEPYNDRNNWRIVSDAHDEQARAWFSRGETIREWFADAFGARDDELWSRYAAALYECSLKALGDAMRLQYLLYENRITGAQAGRFGDLRGVMLQCKAGDDGLSKNPAIKAIQAASQRHRCRGRYCKEHKSLPSPGQGERKA